MSALGDKNVGGLNVAVDDSFGVRGIQSVRNLNPQLQNLLKRQRLAGNAMLQGDTVQILHGDKRLPVLFANLVDGANVGVIQCGCGLSFAFETSESLRVVGNFLWQEFQRHEAMKPGVFCFVDDAHAAAAEFSDDAVVRNRTPDNR